MRRGSVADVSGIGDEASEWVSLAAIWQMEATSLGRTASHQHLSLSQQQLDVPSLALHDPSNASNASATGASLS